MTTAYHFKSASDINLEDLNAIKRAFKDRPIVLTVQEEDIIPEDQKQFVRDSIKKYEQDKSLLIDEETAWKMINSDK